jgi:hypothetical protein
LAGTADTTGPGMLRPRALSCRSQDGSRQTG